MLLLNEGCLFFFNFFLKTVVVSRFGHCVFMVKHGLIFLAERVFRILMFSVELEHGGIRELLLIVCKGYRLSFFIKRIGY